MLMSQHFQKEVEQLKKRLFSLCGLVEQSVRLAVQAVQNRDVALAGKVMEGDPAIDHMEVDVEEECLKVLALYQPVAADLRFIVSVLKINNDLERIGDLAVNVAERARFLAFQDAINIPFDFPGMAEKVQWMLRKSIDSLISMDSALARDVFAADEQVDAINRQMYDQVKRGIIAHPEWLDSLIHLLCVSRHLERIADLATNIAEDVVYLVEGEIARHSTEDYRPAGQSNEDTSQ